MFRSIGTLPYAAIAAHAGSVSLIDKPMRAIYAALGLQEAMWIGSPAGRSRRKRSNTSDSQ